MVASDDLAGAPMNSSLADYAALQSALRAMRCFRKFGAELQASSESEYDRGGRRAANICSLAAVLKTADYAFGFNPPYEILSYGIIGIPLTYFLEPLFARKGAHASRPRRALLQNVGLGVLVFSALFSGATALAADKTSIELACGGSKVTITCQKFKDEACVASRLTFDKKDGMHVVSTYQPPQHFVAPTIADSLQCDPRPPMGTYFVVWYTPGCPGAQAQCITIKLFDLSGKKLTSKEEKTVYEYPSHATPKKPVSLRGHN